MLHEDKISPLQAHCGVLQRPSLYFRWLVMLCIFCNTCDKHEAHHVDSGNEDSSPWDCQEYNMVKVRTMTSLFATSAFDCFVPHLEMLNSTTVFEQIMRLWLTCTLFL